MSEQTSREDMVKAISAAHDCFFDLRALTFGAQALIDVDEAHPEASSILRQIAERCLQAADLTDIPERRGLA